MKLILLTEENSKLKFNKYLIPFGIKTHLSTTFENYKGEKTEDGYKRLSNLVNTKYITYHELKRIKNFFDTYSGKKTDPAYILNGSDPMRAWVEKTLSNARENVINDKETTKKSGLTNTYKSKHTRLN